MRGQLVRLVAGREIRDLLRDRRSLYLLLALPVLLYPGFGLVGFLFALSMLDQPSIVGIAGGDALPQPTGDDAVIAALRSGIWQLGPAAANSAGIGSAVGTVADLLRYAPLISDGKVVPRFCRNRAECELMRLVPIANDDLDAVDRGEVDVALRIPAEFRERLTRGESTTIEVRRREGDENSKLAARRVTEILKNYGESLKRTRFARLGLPFDFDSPLVVREPRDDEPGDKASLEELRERLSRFLPFMMVMWALAGALHPAIDVCAGEKERGTLETLLIAPVHRSEVVSGKFLAVFSFASGAAIWNLAWMGALSLFGSWYFQANFVRPAGLLWCALFALPLAALFSALSIALGMFARSSKEGQYYLVPLFLATLPLLLYTALPQAELSWATSVVPVTGVCLLLQKLLATPATAGVLIYLIPIAASLAICIAAAGAWAVHQFSTEAVLFRDAEAGGGLAGLFRR